MPATLVDKDRFIERAGKIYKAWGDTSVELLSKADALVFGIGSDLPDYGKSQTLQTWLFGYELTDALVVLCKNKIFFLSSKKKIEFLKPIDDGEEHKGLPGVELLIRDKADKDSKNFETILEGIKESGNGNVIGEFSKEKHEGDFMDAWKKAVESSELEKLDVTLPMSRIWAPKDENERDLIKKACESTCNLWNKHVRKQLIEIVDQEKKIKHERIAEGMDEALKDRKVIGGLNTDNLESCFTPIVQSGGKYNLKFSALSDKTHVHFGAIVCTFGARYKSYCSAISRTMLVDPGKDVEEAYEAILAAEEAIISALRPGAVLKDVYQKGLEVVKEKKPELVDSLTKSFGFATGIEFREGTCLIGPNNSEKVQEGMVFIVQIGASKVNNKAAKDDEGKRLAISIGDTVVVNKEKTESQTEAAKKRYKSLAIMFTDPDEKDDNDNNKENIKEVLGRGKRSVIVNQKREKDSGDFKRKQHQKELAEQLNIAAQERLARTSNEVEAPKVRKSTVSYKNVSQMPDDRELKSLQIYVDKKYETIILPIFGIPVPFHISMIKNISQSVEGNFTYLRINFYHPGSTIGRESNMFPNPLATFMKEMTYRSSNLKEPGELTSPSSNLNHAFRIIKEVQKRFRTREDEEKQKEGAVKQDKLVLSQNKGNPRLKDLYIRPHVISKRVPGTLDAHLNGFRYTSLRGDKVDILFNNIKHAFFQPCDKEVLILLHFHLKNPILFGRKKCRDLQFFTEVGEVTTDLGKYHHMQDRDDVYAEQAERELRHKLNLAFQSFCDKVSRMTNEGVEFDSPFRDLGFFGVPHRSSVLVMPTSTCLVAISEWPPFVVTLDEIELVHFERVSFQLKNFDMVFIFKDYKRKTEMVQQIPMNQLDSVKEWLNSCDIRYTEGVQSLNWAKIMKTITDDPESFFEDGGWNFLNAESDDEGENADDSDEGDDAYAPTDEEGEDEEESESDEDEGTPDPSSESESEASLDSEEESGKDWSDLEEQAKKADREREDDSDDGGDRERRKRKAMHMKHSSHSSPKKSKHSSSPRGEKRSKHSSSPRGEKRSKHRSSSDGKRREEKRSKHR